MSIKRLLPPLLLLARRPPPTRAALPSLHRRPLPVPKPHTLIRLSSSTTPHNHTFTSISSLSAHPSPTRLLIDVREPSEIGSTGRIPSAVAMPLTSNPDAVYLDPDTFHERFGFRKPGLRAGAKMGEKGDEEGEEVGPHVAGHGGADVGVEGGGGGGGGGLLGGEGEGEVEEVVFYCKAGVRSRAAAQMAMGEGGWKGVRVGQWGGGWVEWEKMGGKVER